MKGKIKTRFSDMEKSGRRTEWICEHNIGHHQGVHGCDGCCANEPQMEKTTKDESSQPTVKREEFPYCKECQVAINCGHYRKSLEPSSQAEKKCEYKGCTFGKGNHVHLNPEATPMKSEETIHEWKELKKWASPYAVKAFENIRRQEQEELLKIVKKFLQEEDDRYFEAQGKLLALIKK